MIVFIIFIIIIVNIIIIYMIMIKIIIIIFFYYISSFHILCYFFSKETIQIKLGSLSLSLSLLLKHPSSQHQPSQTLNFQDHSDKISW